MSSSRSRRKLQVIASLSVLLLMAGAVACNGFFVDPTLNSMTVSTTQSTNLVNIGNTVQLSATGAYDDGSKKNLTGKSTWSVTTNPDFVSVNQSGLVTALKVSPAGTTAMVQAAAQSRDGSVVSGSTTITLGQSTSTSLTITSSLGTTISLAQSQGLTINFTATLSGTDKTSVTTFTSSNSSIISITSGSTGTVGSTTGTVTITGTDSTDNATGTLTITVSQ
jgi:hypothetical protein